MANESAPVYSTPKTASTPLYHPSGSRSPITGLFGYQMIRSTTAIVLTAILASCEERAAKFPYLSEELNQGAKISSAEHIALTWERNVAWGCFGPVHAPVTLFPLRIRKAHVSFGKRRVDLRSDRTWMTTSRLFGGRSPQRWKEFGSVRKLARDPFRTWPDNLRDYALIDLSWGCEAGEVTSPNCTLMTLDKLPKQARTSTGHKFFNRISITTHPRP